MKASPYKSSEALGFILAKFGCFQCPAAEKSAKGPIYVPKWGAGHVDPRPRLISQITKIYHQGADGPTSEMTDGLEKIWRARFMTISLVTARMRSPK